MSNADLARTRAHGAQRRVRTRAPARARRRDPRLRRAPGPRALERSLLAFVLVRTDERTGENTAGAELAAVPEVLEVHHVAGQDSYLVKVRVKDPEALGRLLRERFGAIAGVRSTMSTIALETLKESWALPIEPLPMPTGSDCVPDRPRARSRPRTARVRGHLVRVGKHVPGDPLRDPRHPALPHVRPAVALGGSGAARLGAASPAMRGRVAGSG